MEVVIFLLVGFALDFNNGFLVQYGKGLSWQQIIFPITFTHTNSIVICDIGSTISWGFKTIYNVTNASFYINMKNSTGGNITTMHYYIAAGY